VSVEIYDSTLGAASTRLYARLGRDALGGVLGIYTNLITRAERRSASSRGQAAWLDGRARRPECANYPEQYLAHGADVVVVGEGEETLAELLPALGSRGPHRLHGIAGTTFRDEAGKLVINQLRAQIADIDSLPWPDRAAIDLPRYVDTWRTHHGMGSVNLITARGCPYKCKWCSHAVFGYSYRRRDVGRLRRRAAAHSRGLPTRPGVVFGRRLHHQPPLALRYAAELRRRNLHLPFETDLARRPHDEGGVLETLAEMGCYRIWIGAESGSQRVLDAMQRGVKVEQVEWATKAGAAARHRGRDVPDVGLRRARSSKISRRRSTSSRSGTPTLFLTTVAYPDQEHAVLRIGRRPGRC
jgi:hypothetical protein